MAKSLVEENIYDLLMPNQMVVLDSKEITFPEPHEMLGKKANMSNIVVDYHNEVNRIPKKTIIGRGDE